MLFYQKAAVALTDVVDFSVSSGMTLRDRSFNLLRNAILDGRFKAGEKLIERELCAFTGASRSVLRVALASLEAKGLIENQAYCGYSISVLSQQKIWEIFELRMCLETLAVELFVERASEQEISVLKSAFAQLMECATPYNTATMRAAKEHFYDVVFTGCRNSEIRCALSTVMDRICLLRTQSMQSAQRRARSFVEMRRLTEALVARDRDGARAACRAHLSGARDALLLQAQSAREARNSKARNGS